jgi:hypothetical protein
MPMQGFFNLMTPNHLLQKLAREYEAWKEAPLDVDVAWNFFVTAEHLPDWLAQADPKALGGYRITTFKRAHALTRICAHLANGAKHFRPREKPAEQLNTSVDHAVREVTGYVEDGYIEDGYYAEELALRVHLTPDELVALQRDGVPITAADIDALWLAARVLAFWQARVL